MLWDQRILSRVTFFKSSLYSNAIYIYLTTVSSAVFGFLFWVIAAKYYPSSEVGIVTALLSVMSLIVLIAKSGFEQSIIRYFPKYSHYNKSLLLSTSIWVASVICLTLCISYIVIVKSTYETLGLFGSIVYISIIICNIISLLIGYSFIALRSSRYRFVQSLAMGTRIIFLPFLLSLGVMGLLVSTLVSYFITSIVSVYLLQKCGVKLVNSIDIKSFKDVFSFTTSNTFINIFSEAQNYILPSIVLVLLGAEFSAYYYIGFTIASILFMVPTSLAISMFVESSNGLDLKKTAFKSIIGGSIVLIPLVSMLIACSDTLLQLVNSDYIVAASMLEILSLSSFMVLIVNVYYSICRVRNTMAPVIFISFSIFILTIVSSVYLLPMFGLIGIGYAWLIGYGFGIGILTINEIYVRNSI